MNKHSSAPKEYASVRIAVISDIHGNSYALEEVLRDIKNRQIETIINLGDSLYGPLDPKGTFELLISKQVQSIAGNQDRIILESMDSTSTLITLEYVKSQLNDQMLDWLNELPFEMIIDELIYCCHGTPRSDEEYLLEKLYSDHIEVKDSTSIIEILAEIDQYIILAGHSHVPRIVSAGEKMIINPGSVGLPAYDDELPVYHKMENFNPKANFSILTLEGTSVSIDRVSVEYDFEKAARLAEKNLRDDWARWIRTGRV